MAFPMALHQLLIPLTNQSPEPEDVTAGGIGALVLVLLVLAVVLLGFSLVKQLRKAQAAEDAGLYDHDDPPVEEGADGEADADPDTAVAPAADEESDADNNGEPHRTA